MSKNEEEEVVEETEDEIDDDEINNETEEEATDWKSKFKEEEGRRKRAETKLSKSKETKPPSKSDELDYGKKAFLVANGIKGSKEMELVESIVKETGKTIEQVIESKYFQAELKEIRDLKTTEDATPKGSKRTGQSAKDTVGYWIAKGELPTDRKLRQEVVNARIKKETNKDVFG